MATITRGTKANGSTSLADGTTVLAAELNTDFDTIVTEINGGLSNVNVSASALIAPTKIDDYASTVTVARTQTNPATSGSESQATSLAGEIERLRYTIQQSKVGFGAGHYDGTTITGHYYGDYPVRGRNLVRNSSFEAYAGAANTAPTYWALVGTPTTVAQATTDVTNGAGSCISVVCRASFADGISQTFSKLRASQRYMLVGRYIVTAGALHVTTTGATAAGSFRNIDRTFSSATWADLGISFDTDATPTDIVISFIGTADATTDSFKLDNIELRECNSEVYSGTGYLAVAKETTNAAPNEVTTVDRAFPFSDPLTVTIAAPGPGYQIKVTAKLCFTFGAASQTVVGSLYESGGAGIVDSAASSATLNDGDSVTLFNYNGTPTPGFAYVYTVQAVTDTGTATPNGTIAAVVLKSRILAELIPPG